MLGLGSYLHGVAAILVLVVSAWLGASALRLRLVPDFTGAPAHLATSVVALALLILPAELLGTVGLFEVLPYLVLVAVIGVSLWTLLPRVAQVKGVRGQLGPQNAPSPATGPAGRGVHIQPLIALALGLFAVIDFLPGVRESLGEGMTGFDSTWYHAPFAAGFAQTGDTWNLHFIAPQFLAWFYPATAEIPHAIGMLAFDRDILSPLLNLGWFAGCLFAFWCIGRPHGVGVFSVLLGALVLRAPLLADQAGEARNDLAGTFFLLAAVAIGINAATSRKGDRPGLGAGAIALAGLAAGLAAGTKLNFLLPAAVFVAGIAVIAPAGERRRALGVGALASIVGGGYWYLRNLFQSGNPLPWFTEIGPITLPGPDQALGGREGHSVLGYLTDWSVWSDWFLPGLSDGLTVLWPVFAVLALAGLALSLGPRSSPALRVAAAVGLAAALAWLIAPTSASGPDGSPRGFESGLRYLAPALLLGLALLPVVLPERLGGRGTGHLPNGRILKAPTSLGRRLSGREVPRASLAVVFVLAVAAIGYPVQRHYLEGRYADPSFTTPGLNVAFAWSRDVSGARIATTSTRQYPLFGTDLSNRVEFVGVERPDGGFVAPETCPEWRRLLDEGEYDYAVTSFDRIEPGQPPFPPSTTWTESPNATVVLKEPPTTVFKLKGRLDPSTCQQ